MASRLLLFTCPKEGDDPHIMTIQGNALVSWAFIDPPDYVNFSIWQDMIPRLDSDSVYVNEHGTPIVPAIFKGADLLFQMIPYHMYVNADIMLRNDIVRAMEAAIAKFERFLLIGRRWDVDITAKLTRKDTLKAAWMLPRTHHQPAGIDYFLYPRGTFDFSKWPPFALGRFRWDNWIVWHALKEGIPVIDCSDAVTPLHQNHGYGHFSSNSDEEIAENGRLACESGLDKWCTTDDATYIMEDDFTIHDKNA